MMKLGLAAAAALLATSAAYAQNGAEERTEVEAERGYEASNEAEAEAEAEDAEPRTTERRSTLPPRPRPRRDYTRGPRRPR